MAVFYGESWISERMAATGGRASGFDYMRFALALSVILFHTIITSYGTETQRQVTNSLPGLIWHLILPMFFALSGFLVAGSLERTKSIGVFLGLRIFRIFPALAVDTIFCALILGPLLTQLPLGEYFSNSEFRAYFLNIAGYIHYYLPGVFVDNPSGKVNGQLWTIPVELECYVTLTAFGLFGLHRRRWLLLALSAIIWVFFEARVVFGLVEASPTKLLLFSFLAGVIGYQFRDRIRLNAIYFSLAVLAGCLLVDHHQLMYLAAVPITYITIYLGLLNPRKSKFLESGDYSYGLFLYGYPLQQALVSLIPLAREWYWNAFFAIPLALLFSMMSWHFVEKRVLARKKILFSAHEYFSSVIIAARTALFSKKI